jgi:two-component system nitrate/nitrite sensor histidine kinase NarX
VVWKHSYPGLIKSIIINSDGKAHLATAKVAYQVLYIFGEILSNVEEHAMAHRVEVKLFQDRGGLMLVVRDDGRGFDLHASHSEGHLGLNIIRERAEEIQGKLNIRSKRGSGTEVSLCLPYIGN